MHCLLEVFAQVITSSKSVLFGQLLNYSRLAL
jgi:hypothetical protein